MTDHTGSQKTAILCDFDGTITLVDTIGVIYENFAGPECWELVEKWRKAELSTPDEIRGCFETIHATRTELESVLDTIQIDPAFPALLDLSTNHGYRFMILSDGLRWYIEYILERHGYRGLQVYANEIEFDPAGYRITLPWYNPETPLRGVSKSTIIQGYQEQGYRVVFIGDGMSDIEAVRFADRSFASDMLLAYCRQNSIPAEEFNELSDVIAKWGNG